MVRKIKPSKDERRAADPRPDEPDEFLAASRNMFDWVSEHSRLTLTILGVLFAGGVVYAATTAYGDHVDVQASRLFAEMIEAQRAAVLEEGQPAPEGEAVTFQSQQQKAEAVRKAAEAVIAGHTGHGTAQLAQLYRGQACIELDDGACATEAFELALAGLRPDDPLRNSARLGVAAAQEQAGKRDEAIKTYQAIADASPRYGKDAALYQAARLLIAVEQPDGAKPLLERLESDYPESPYKSDAQRLQDILK